MVPGVIIMTTYKLVVIPHTPSQSGINPTCKGVMVDTSADKRYLPFGHLPKEYVQVRRSTFDEERPYRAALQYCSDYRGDDGQGKRFVTTGNGKLSSSSRVVKVGSSFSIVTSHSSRTMQRVTIASYSFLHPVLIAVCARTRVTYNAGPDDLHRQD